MIIIHCPIKQDYIIELLQEPTEGFTFRFVKKEGMKLFFEIGAQDMEQAIAFAKAKIKSTDIGKVLYFQVTAG